MISVTDDSFDSEVLDCNTPVLVDFWASWCAPCRTIAPLLEKLETEFKGQLKVVKVDVEQNRQLATDFEITNIPTLLLFKGGAVIADHVGSITYLPLKAFVEPHL